VTLRQILAVLWARKWIVVVIVVCALLAAVTYLALRTVTYSSEAKIRLNTVVAGGATSDDIGGVAVDFSEQTITSPTALDAAGKRIGESGSALAGAVTASVSNDGHTTSVVVHAIGSTPRDAQQRATAVITAYTSQVDTEVARVLVVLQQREQAAIQQAQVLQRQVAADPANSIASTNLATELSRMSSISTEVDSINNAGPTASVVQAAAPGDSTVPGLLVVVLLALTTGLVVGVGTALIRDQFDDRLRREEDLTAVVDAPMLGGLSWDRRVARANVPLPVAGTSRTDLGEGLRTLRSNLQVLLPPHGVVVVTSVEPGDGKSFISSNLALAWARAGKRVVLVGGDLRKPDLRRYFGDAAVGEGFVEALEQLGGSKPISNGDLFHKLNKTAYDGLFVLPPGRGPDEPADLLARVGTGVLLQGLRELADIVIIDSPPGIALADASLLAAHADGAIVIATEGRTMRSRLVEAVLALKANGASVLGVVVNRSTRKLPRTYSAYYLRQGSPPASYAAFADPSARTPARSWVPSDRSDPDDESPASDAGRPMGSGGEQAAGSA